LLKQKIKNNLDADVNITSTPSAASLLAGELGIINLMSVAEAKKFPRLAWNIICQILM
jgi:hypothetical protein